MLIKYINGFVIILLFAILMVSCKENTVEPVLTGNINGKVIDSKTGSVLGSSSITTNPATNAIVTDNSGSFNIKDIAVGSYTITAKKSGYKTSSVTVTVKENVTTQAIIQLDYNPASNTLTEPSNPSPKNQATDNPLNLTLTWSSSTAGNGSITYDVYMYNSESSTPTKIASEISDTLVDVSGLKYNKTYFWQVIVNDTANSINGDVWSFTTKQFPNNPFTFIRMIDGNYKLFTADSLDENSIQLLNTSNKEIWPRFNPNKTKIAFVSDVNLENQIYTVNVDGSGFQKITNLSVAGYNNIGIGFSWAPDGGSLIYAHYDKLYRINSDGSNLKVVATAPTNRHFRECEFSPLGDKIVVETMGPNPYDSEIYIMNSDGSNVKLIVDNLPGIIERPSFSTDGKSIMYTHDVSGFESADGRQLNSHIFLKSLIDSTITDLSFNKINGTNDTNPRFSPDGGSIIFNNSKNDGSGNADVWLVDLSGEYRHKIITNGLMPDWKR